MPENEDLKITDPDGDVIEFAHADEDEPPVVVFGSPGGTYLDETSGPELIKWLREIFPDADA